MTSVLPKLFFTFFRVTVASLTRRSACRTPNADDARVPRLVSFSPRVDPLTLDLADLETRLAAAFIARYGVDMGKEITAEAMAWAWEHRTKLAKMDNPAGYLFRVGQSKSRKLLRWSRESVRFPAEQVVETSTWTEPALPEALTRLGEQERTAIVLVHCFQWTYAEVCELLGLPLHTVRNRIHRGLAQLRDDLGVEA